VEVGKPTSSANAAADIVGDIVENAASVNEASVTLIEEDAANVDQPEAGEGADQPNSNAQAAPRTVSTAYAVDSGGVVFDPSRHEVQDDGRPRLTQDGRFRRKRGGGGQPRQPKPDTAYPATSTVDESRRVAEVLAGIAFGFLESTFGEAWRPTGQERESIVQTGGVVCSQYGVSDMPPVIGLMFAVTMYALPRINDPETRERWRALTGREVVSVQEVAEPNKSADTAKPPEPYQNGQRPVYRSVPS
jgi:hypothetical protein